MKKWDSISDWFLESRDSDFEIHAETEKGGKEVVFPGHGFVLNKVSPVFQVMLETGSFVEIQTKIVKLKIYGDETDALAFVRWFYTKELKERDENSYVSLMRTAHMYEVKELVEECEKRLRKDLKPITICQLYCSLQNIASENFLSRCKTFMANNSTYIFRNSLHFSLDEETLAYLVGPGKTDVEAMTSSFGPSRNNAICMYLNESRFMDEEAFRYMIAAERRRATESRANHNGKNTLELEELILDALWEWLQARCLFEGKNHIEESRKVMPNLIKRRPWINLHLFNKNKPWYDLVTEFAEGPNAGNQPGVRRSRSPPARPSNPHFPL